MIEEEEENILQNITFENIDSGPFVNFRTSFPRRDIKIKHLLHLKYLIQ